MGRPPKRQDTQTFEITVPAALYTFTAIWFVQCLEAIGCHTIHLSNGE